MENILSESVVGQPEAVKAVANTICLLRNDLGNTQRPIASFLIVGPSGTGKTLLSKTVSTDGSWPPQSNFFSYSQLLQLTTPVQLPTCYDPHRCLRILGETFYHMTLVGS